jgi:long-chain acyl-CoA synthetase
MLTLSSALDRARRQFTRRVATVDEGLERDWGDHVTRVAALAGGLAAAGVGAGEAFAIIAPNSARYTEWLHAGYWSGAVPVPINHRLAPPEIAQILEDASCKLLLHGRDFPVASWTGPRLAIEDDHLSTPLAPRVARPDDLALLLYTGGTTGRAKGVKLTHGNIVANGLQVGLAMQATAADRFLHAAPMFHAADLLSTCFTLVGASHAYLPAFSGGAMLRALSEQAITVAFMAPTMIILTLQEPDFARFKLDRLRLLFYGSSPMAAEWVKRAMAGFPSAGLEQGYGLTETSPILTVLDPDDHRAALSDGRLDVLRSAGRAVPGVELRVDAAPGQIGEVLVRGPNVTPGYLNRPDETAAAFEGSWFHTGDMGQLDPTGLLTLVDRKKDMIVTGGENVYSSEVEAVLYAHDGVQEAAVIGVPHATYGEALLAVVVARPGVPLDPQMLIEHCRGRIGGYKIPRRIELVAALPKSAMGKILKTELRRLYAGRKTQF